jgi:hypothetical protein
VIPAHQIGMQATQAVHVLLLAGQSSAAFAGTQTEWLRHAGVIHSSRLRAPDDQVTEELYANFAALLKEARDNGVCLHQPGRNRRGQRQD